jgi:hypothetical protein
MGTSCAKPTRANTEQSTRFMSEFLWPVMYAVHYAAHNQQDAAQAHLDLQQHPQADLVTGWHVEQGRVKVNVSAKRLQALYGRPALRIWRKLFVQDRPGGYSRSTGKAFDSSWYLNAEADRRYFFGVTRYLSKGGITPAQALALLDDIEERVNGIVEYKVRECDRGFKSLVAAKRREITVTVRKVHLQAARPLRVQLSKLNVEHKKALADRAEQRYQNTLAGLRALLKQRRELRVA